MNNRRHNTDRNDRSFDQAIIKTVWNKAKQVPGEDPKLIRQDCCGARIKWREYGNTNSPNGYGWEIDHIDPVANGGSDSLSNLQALQWKNNRSKGDKTNWSCSVTYKQSA